MAIISRRLFFAISLWEDAKMETLAKVFRYIERFDRNREASPWLARVVVSACEDVKKKYGASLRASPQAVEKGSMPEEFTEAALEEWIAKTIGASGEDRDRNRFEDMWFAVNAALERACTDELKKMAFLLFYRYGYRLREIAEALRLPQSKVNNWPGTVLKTILPDVKAALHELGYASVEDGATCGGEERREQNG